MPGARSGYESAPQRCDSIDGRHYKIKGSGQWTGLIFAYPSITNILGKDKVEILERWRKAVGDKEADRKSSAAAGIGTNFHHLCEHYLMGNGVEHIQDPLGQRMFASAKSALNEIDDISAMESAVYSHQLKLAGTLDLRAMYKGKMSLIDFKTSYEIKQDVESYFLQTWFYAKAWEDMYGEKTPNLVAINVDYFGNVKVTERTFDEMVNQFYEFLKRVNYDISV